MNINIKALSIMCVIVFVIPFILLILKKVIDKKKKTVSSISKSKKIILEVIGRYCHSSSAPMGSDDIGGYFYFN